LNLIVGSLIIFAAAVIAGLSGFGFGLVAMSVLPLIMDVKIANPILTLFTFILTPLIVIPLRRSIDLRSISYPLIGSAIGIPVGMYVLVKVESFIIKTALGVFIILYLLYRYLCADKPLPQLTRKWGVAAGLLSGALTSAFASGGPPIVMYLSSKNWEKDQLKVNIILFLFVQNLFKVSLLIWNHMITREVLIYYAVFIPPALIGLYGGTWLFRRITGRVYSIIVHSLLFASAIGLLLSYRTR
jgi:uncharacterized protein